MRTELHESVPTKFKYLNIELLSGLHTRLKVLAAMRETTMSALLDEALQDLLEKHDARNET